MDDIVAPSVVDAALKAWFSGNQSESDRGLEASMRLAIAAALKAISASGEWAVVPRTPTQEMLDAGFTAISQLRGAKSVWLDMLNARPGRV